MTNNNDLDRDLDRDSVNTKFDNFEKARGHKLFQVSFNPIKVVKWFMSKEKTKDDFEWRYKHTNYVCKEPVDRTQAYCPKCGGELVYKEKR